MLNIPLRSINNPFLNPREINELLSYLATIQQTLYTRQKKKPICVKISRANELPNYSIFTIANVSGRDFDITQAYADYWNLENPAIEPDGRRQIYCTNGNEPIRDGILLCDIIGDNEPYPIRYQGATPIIGTRMDMVTQSNGVFNEPLLEFNPTGPFTCVSNGDSNLGLVWVMIHNHQLSYIPWVRTTVAVPGDPIYNSETAIYPPDGANTFVVERGQYDYDDSKPGYQNATFIPTSPRELYIAIHPCGYLLEGSIKRMSVDRGKWYMFYDCTPIPSSSVSSSSVSSSSVSSSSVSSSSVSSSVSSSSAPSSSVSSSSAPSSSASSVSSSSVSSSSVSSSKSSATVFCSEDCTFQYQGGTWVALPSIPGRPVCQSNPLCSAEVHCEPLTPFPEEPFEGQFWGGECKCNNGLPFPNDCWI